MEIYLGLNYTSNAFVNLKDCKGICLDHTVVSPEGLLSLLELHLGIHYEDVSVTDRQAAYYAAFRKIMGKGKNIFSDSWEKNDLGVSNECLRWRDALRANGWQAQMRQPSERLQLLALIENEFHILASGDRMERLYPLLQQRNPLPAGSHIHVAAKDERGIPPMIVRLLKVLHDKGTEIVYETDETIAPKGSNLARIQQLLINNTAEDQLREKDSSFKIWKFNTELDAARYVATQPKDDFDVYVTADGKLLDNVQRMLLQPTSGSSETDAHPQIAQLFKLGMSLFEYPFNIRNLISWLLVPLHPIKSDLRRTLVNTMINTGGYNNEEYKETITAYQQKLKDEAEDEKKAIAAIDKLNHKLEIFIPTPQAEGVSKKTLLQFIKSLSNWCRMMVNLDNLDPNDRSQLTQVDGLCQSLVSIVEEEPDNALIPFRKIESWTSALYSGTNLEIYGNQAGSRWTVAAEDIVDATDNLLWTDCYNSAVAISPTDFLNVYERKELARQGCLFWDDTDFNTATMRALLRPVLKCKKQLVIVVTATNKGEDVAKHPLMIRLEKAFPNSLSTVCETPDNHEAEKKAVNPVDNYTDCITLHVRKNMEMPKTESYSSLENLIQYPLDYVMDRILKLRDRSYTEMDTVATVKGNVAHAVIEKLFIGNAQEIASNLQNHFTETLQRTTEEKGAILLLQENRIEWHLFNNQLKECLEALLQIIRDNQLTVIGREQRVSHKIGLMKKDSDPTINGFVDMTLQNPKGEILVFDFKWTSSRKYHKELLKKNASIQLALYEHLVSLESHCPVVATAYFTMPWHKLYTTSPYIAVGAYVEHVSPANNDVLLEKIKNSYRYRREQLQKGEIENGEGALLEDIPYALTQNEKGLIPLFPEYNEENIHSFNGFSNYTCFKK